MGWKRKIPVPLEGQRQFLQFLQFRGGDIIRIVPLPSDFVGTSTCDSLINILFFELN